MTTIDNGLEGDGMRITMEYRRAVTDEEIAIAAWAKVKFSRYGDSFFRVLYSHQL